MYSDRVRPVMDGGVIPPSIAHGLPRLDRPSSAIGQNAP